jgi:hypothetical protein
MSSNMSSNSIVQNRFFFLLVFQVRRVHPKKEGSKLSPHSRGHGTNYAIGGSTTYGVIIGNNIGIHVQIKYSYFRPLNIYQHSIKSIIWPKENLSRSNETQAIINDHLKLS